MKSLTFALFFIIFVCNPAYARSGGGHSGGSHARNTHSTNGGSHSVKSYVKKDGTYVAPSHATNPNSTKRDNWSTKGNFNPHNGKAGTKDPGARK